MTKPFVLPIRDYFRNFHYMAQSDPDFIRTKPRMIAQVQFQRANKIKSILCLI